MHLIKNTTFTLHIKNVLIHVHKYARLLTGEIYKIIYTEFTDLYNIEC